MPCLSGVINNRLQAIIDVGVSPVSQEKQGTLASRTFRTLVDTGANATCISKKVKEALALDPIGKAQMQGANHAAAVMECAGSNEFDVIIGMDIIMQGSLSLSLDGRFVFCL